MRGANVEKVNTDSGLLRAWKRSNPLQYKDYYLASVNLGEMISRLQDNDPDAYERYKEMAEKSKGGKPQKWGAGW